jgi:hypothetical protein
MAIYDVTDNATGKSYEIEGDRPPTEKEVSDLIKSMGDKKEFKNPEAEAFSKMPWWERARIGMGRGFVEVGQGIKQTALKVAEATGIAPEKAAQAYTDYINQEKQTFESYGKGDTATGAGRFLGNIAPAMAIPGAGGTTGLARIGLSAATGAGLGFVQPTETASLGENVRNAAVGGAIAGAIPTITSALSKPLPKSLTPDQLNRLRVAEETGTPISIAEIKQTKPWALLEGGLKREISSAGRGEKFIKGVQGGMERYKEGLKSNFFGTADDASVAGKEAIEKAAERSKTWFKKAQDIYKKIPVQGETPVPTTNLAETASQYLDEIGNLHRPSLNKLLGIASEDVTKTTSPLVDQFGKKVVTESPAYTWSQLVDDRNFLNQLRNKATDYNKKRIYGDLIDAIDDDVKSFSEMAGGKVSEALKKAREFYRKGDMEVPGAEIFRNKEIARKILYNSNPEDITRDFIKPNNVSSILRLKSAVGDEGMKPLKSVWFDRLTRTGEEQSFSPNKFATAIEKYDDETLKAFLKPDEIKGIKLLVERSRIAKKIEELGGNPSGTSQQASLTAKVWMGLTHPMVTVVHTLGANRFGKLYFENPTFRKMFISGIQAPEGSKFAVDMAARLSAISATNQQEGE